MATDYNEFGGLMSDDKEVIAQLGGATKLAQLLGYSIQRVQNWTVRGIPAQVKVDHPDLFLQHTLARAAQTVTDDTSPKRRKDDVAHADHRS
jgi:phage terminase Nu1 subunit (DNA packaging protein)